MDIKNRIDLLSEKELLEKIREGFINNEFKLYLQFIVANATKEIVSFEALSRWENDAGELIFPGKYIGLMEKSGLIVDFDYYMFDKVCSKLSEWKDSDFDKYIISCNITRITISETDFAEKIKKIADKYEFDRAKLLIEITEDTIERNMDVAKNNILKVKNLGFVIALDDIGSGYASFLNLGEYPVDVVKLDRDVLLQAEKDGKVFLETISLLHELGFKVVCEGVETEEQNTLVSSSECDYIQGWYYSKVLSETDILQKAKEYTNSLQR